MHSIVYHQCIALHIINAQHCISSMHSIAYHQVAEKYTPRRDDMLAIGEMIYTLLRAVMICQVCDLDKKITLHIRTHVRKFGLQTHHERGEREVMFSPLHIKRANVFRVSSHLVFSC